MNEHDAAFVCKFYIYNHADNIPGNQSLPGGRITLARWAIIILAAIVYSGQKHYFPAIAFRSPAIHGIRTAPPILAGLFSVIFLITVVYAAHIEHAMSCRNAVRNSN
jgi:hypothetical protein